MDNESKHVHISSPKGPEDASNIADEYPSPERTPATLSENVSEQQIITEESVQEQEQEQEQEQVQDQSQPPQHDHHAHQQEETDMQTELANQVAAQAIEAAVAAEVRANASTSNSVTQNVEEGNTNNNQDTDIDMSAEHTQQDHMQSTHHHPHQQHNPRQPTFPRSRSSLSYLPSATSSNAQNAHSSSQHHIRPSNSSKPVVKMDPNQQIVVLREAYAKNPNPSKKELESLAEKTGRPWNKIREYFRQRRNKLRGLEDLESMQEPGRASGWLQVAYRQAPATSSITQLSLYNSYKHRFDPYSITTPLLGGQELIQLACATFPGCEMAKDEQEYVLKGLKEKEKEKENDNESGNNTANSQSEQGDWEKGMEGLVEPLRAGSWLLSSFQHQNDPNAPSTLTQTDLYTSYAARFSSLLTNAGQAESNDNADQEQDQQNAVERPTQEEQDHEADMRAFEDAGLNSANDGNDQNEDQGQNQEEQQNNIDVNEQHQSLASSLALLPDPPASNSIHTDQIPTPLSSTPTPSPAPQPAGTGPAQAGQTQQQRKKENRLLNPFELINLTRMTFPKCEPIIDSSGKFVIKGLERRLGHEPGSKEREREMFNFALYNESKPGEAFVGLMKRKLGLLLPDPSSSLSNPSNPTNNTTKEEEEEEEVDGNERESKKLKVNNYNTNDDKLVNKGSEKELDDEDKELIQGLKRFRGSKLGEEVRDVCISQ
ncbi:uncharacterized protein L201_002058 [Kwoniella dendrophila CBS 6074]|uniref:Homeobox domain-containing protein n=1 Tax=Kwoniella dendrophila CBS 6074 TaxID=1295534 RepID=A0AAX4JP59_9TREE